MKTFLLTLMLGFSLWAPSTAQNFPFPTSDAEWVTTWGSACLGGSEIYSLWRDYIGGDTVIEQKVYKKIYHKPECYLVTQGVHCDYSYTDYDTEAYSIGALRTDNQRVYFRKFSGVSPSKHTQLMPANIDILLYDFDAKIGDTLQVPMNNGSVEFYKITDLTILSDGRKQFTMIHYPNIGFQRLIVEGVGTTVGLFGNYADPFNSALECCFNHNGRVVMSSQYCNFCGNVGVLASPSDFQLKIYPNPASDELLIDMSNESGTHVAKSMVLQVYDLQGQSLYKDLDFFGKANLTVSSWIAHTCILIVLHDPSSAKTWVKKVVLKP